jgi:hypothetical protein
VAFCARRRPLRTTWTDVFEIDRPLTVANTKGDVLSYRDPAFAPGRRYRVVAENTVGDTRDDSDPNLNEIAPGTFAFPVVTAKAVSNTITP